VGSVLIKDMTAMQIGLSYCQTAFRVSCIVPTAQLNIMGSPHKHHGGVCV